MNVKSISLDIGKRLKLFVELIDPIDFEMFWKNKFLEYLVILNKTVFLRVYFSHCQ